MNALQFGIRMSTLCVAAIGVAMSGGAVSQTPADSPTEATVVVAQVAASATTRTTATASNDFPANQRGVRAAAVQGPDALRRYVNRTRMIYGFYYNDFAPKE